MAERKKKGKPSAPKSAPPAFATVDVSSLLDDMAANDAGGSASYDAALNAILESQAGGGAAVERGSYAASDDDASFGAADVEMGAAVDVGNVVAAGTVAFRPESRADSDGGDFLPSERLEFDSDRLREEQAAAASTASIAAAAAAAAAAVSTVSSFVAAPSASVSATPVRGGTLPPMQAPDTGDFPLGSALALRGRADTINAGLVSPSVMHQLTAAAPAAADGSKPKIPAAERSSALRGSIVADGIAAAAAEDEGGDKKDEVRMRVGYYQMTGHGNGRYVFIPKAMLRRPAFDFDEAFAALQMKIPDLVFDLNSAPDVDEYVHCLPPLSAFVCSVISRNVPHTLFIAGGT
jgi:hypothetical protein